MLTGNVYSTWESFYDTYLGVGQVIHSVLHRIKTSVLIFPRIRAYSLSNNLKNTTPGPYTGHVSPVLCFGENEIFSSNELCFYTFSSNDFFNDLYFHQDMQV